MMYKGREVYKTRSLFLRHVVESLSTRPQVNRVGLQKRKLFGRRDLELHVRDILGSLRDLSFADVNPNHLEGEKGGNAAGGVWLDFRTERNISCLKWTVESLRRTTELIFLPCGTIYFRDDSCGILFFTQKIL